MGVVDSVFAADDFVCPNQCEQFEDQSSMMGWGDPFAALGENQTEFVFTTIVIIIIMIISTTF